MFLYQSNQDRRIAQDTITAIQKQHSVDVKKDRDEYVTLIKNGYELSEEQTKAILENNGAIRKLEAELRELRNEVRFKIK